MSALRAFLFFVLDWILDGERVAFMILLCICTVAFAAGWACHDDAPRDVTHCPAGWAVDVRRATSGGFAVRCVR